MRICSAFLNHLRHPFSSKDIKLKKWEKGIAIAVGILLSPLLIFPGATAFYAISYAFKASRRSRNSDKTARTANARFLYLSKNKAWINGIVREALERNDSLKQIQEEIKKHFGEWNSYVAWLKNENFELFSQLFRIALEENRQEVQKFLDHLDMKTLRKLFKNSPDNVQIECSDGGLSFNKQLLSHYIPYFRSMFSGLFPESQTIELDQINKKVLISILNSLFFQKALALKGKNLLQYLHATSFFNLPQLSANCEDWLIDHLDDFKNPQDIFEGPTLSARCEKKLRADLQEKAQAIFDKRVAENDLISFPSELREMLPWVTLHCSTDEHVQLILIHFPDITRLSLANSQSLTSKGWENLFKLSKLQHLNLSYSKITDEDLIWIANLQELQSLNLSYNLRITDEGLQPIAHLHMLQNLHLCRTSVTSDGLAYLTNLSSLQELDLSYNSRITNTGLVYIAQLNTLSRLNLRHTRVTNADLSAFPSILSLDPLSN